MIPEFHGREDPELKTKLSPIIHQYDLGLLVRRNLSGLKSREL